MSPKLRTPHCYSRYLGYLLLLLLLRSADAAGRRRMMDSAEAIPPAGNSGPIDYVCPASCSCVGRTITCSKAGLTSVPSGLPVSVERLNLQSNRISAIKRTDFRGLSRLRVLQLQDNAIERVEEGSFNDLVFLDRLRLNRNRLAEIPDGLFARLSNLYRLDLSHNRLTFIGKDTLSGAPRLRNLQLDHNEIRCLTESAMKGLDRLEILTLNKNNISTLPENAFSRMAGLKTLRLADNNLICDCRLAWLSKWLLLQPQLGLHTKCAHPRQLTGSQVAELASSDFQCSADQHKLYPSACTMAEKATCPRLCYCQEDIVRCNQKGLTEIPADIPTNVQELHLEGNKISRIRSQSFKRLGQLRRLFLNGNRISQIENGAFDGLENLYSLVLSRNSIRELPKGIFNGLKYLQLLLLDANKITCLPEDTFAGTGNLAILSLYKNEIKSIANGTFAPLRSIQQLTIAGNPFICDCNLRWLNDFFQEQPRLASSDNACEGPARLAKKKLGSVKSKKFRCRDEEENAATQNAGKCELYSECPADCKCDGDSVDCSWKRLTALPDNLPVTTSHLKLADNAIREVPANSILKKLKNLQSIDLSNNLISIIQPESFRENENLEVLNLSGNQIRDLDPRMLTGLRKLKILQMSNNKLTCINNDTFLATTEISVLSVSQNQIRCIMEGSFGPLRKLASLHLDLNPLNCNCHMRWLPPYTVSNYQLMRHSQPLCQSPDLLKDTPVVSLKSQHFVCQRDSNTGCHGVPPCCSGDAVSCDPRAICPKQCECEGTAVRCIGQGLREIPENIPMDSTQLFLGQNQIDQLNFTRLNRLRNLKLLDLSHNRLFGLKANMFANMTSLESLTISFNKLACVELRAFAGLRKLKVLILQGNEIASLPFGSFDDLVELTTIGLNQNPIHCDCNVKWLIDFFHKKNVDNGLALCSGPPAMAKKQIYHSRPDDFQCSADTQLQLSRCNVCNTDPCYNGGTCRARSFDRFTCECPSGFEGDRCQNKMDACFGNPCHNEATCEVLRHGRYKCQCKPGFGGVHCEVNQDDCADHRCQNNATCVDRVGSYACSCAAGFAGEFCERRINYCLDYNPCANGGDCTPDGEAGYRCRCAKGWEGRNCDVNPDDCRIGGLCMNGGTCVDGVAEFSCNCRPGYTGRVCEKLELPGLIMDLPDLVNRGICTHHECLNGGRCIQEGSEYRCQCLAGYEGKKCEKLTQVGFHQDSYARVDNPQLFPHGNVTLLLATKQRNGLVLYVGTDSTYLVMSLFDGYIRFSFSLGSPPGANAYSFVRVNDGSFHTVTAVINRDSLTLSVDSMARTIAATYDSSASGAAAATAGLQDSIYLGTLPPAKRNEAQANGNVRDLFSFGGCIKQMLVNDKLVNFKLSQPSNHRLIDGCPSFTKPDNPCDKQTLCKNQGACKPRPDLPEGFRCQCKPNYTGPHCEDKACKRTVSREFYVDSASGCKSRRQLKIRRCMGTCPKSTGYCCQPKKVRHRMIKFVCPGGRRVTKRVTVVRRCGCGPCGNHDLYSYWYHRTRRAAVS